MVLNPGQATPGAPWRIRVTDELKVRFGEPAGDGFVTMQKATRILGVTRQTVLHRVKRGEIETAHVTKGGKIGVYVKSRERDNTLFDIPQKAREHYNAVSKYLDRSASTTSA